MHTTRRMNGRTRRRIITASVLIIAAALITTCAIITALNTKIPQGQAVFRFIDIGQGDCTILSSSDATVVIDTGSTETFGTLLSCLQKYGVRRIDCLILTHPHDDHIGGAAYLLRDYYVGNLVMSNIADDSAVFNRTMKAADENGVEIIYVSAGDSFSAGGFEFTVLSPDGTVAVDDEEVDNANENSLVIRASFGDVSIMLTGDAGEVCEAVLLERMAEYHSQLKCQILKVGHHGSYSASSDAFLLAVDPDYAVISCGRDNEYNHPNPATVARLEAHGAKVFVTSQNGTVTFRTDGTTLTYETETAVKTTSVISPLMYYLSCASRS